MSSFDDIPLSEEEQQKLYAALENLGDAAEVCEAQDITLPPDTDPVVSTEDCEPEGEVLESEFLDPNFAPVVVGPPNLLPAPLSVVSRAASVICPVGRVALAGVEPSIAPAGSDIQLVYLDELSIIAQAEVFRLAAYIDSLQGHVSTNLIAAIDASDFATFDQGIVSITKTSFSVAATIRTALVEAQSTADQIAQAIALSGLVCGWRNRELWVTCQSSAPGYAISYSEPSVEPVARSAPDLFSSEISQNDADEQAARAAALELSCLVTNTEVSVSCSDVVGEVSEEISLVWPVNWVKASSARAAAIGSEVVTLGQQGATSWTVSAWDDYEANTESINLGRLNGQEFVQPDTLGSPSRKRLRTTVIIPAGDPRTAADDQTAANAIAYNLAVAELDCFVPNRPRVISCVTPVYGSEEVSARHAGRGLGEGDISRSATFAELEGGSYETYGGPLYVRANVGVLDYDLPSEREDLTQAFDVYVWPGYFAGTSVAEVESVAGLYGADKLQCVWVSPQHSCECVSTSENAALELVASPDQTSAKFSTDTLAYEGALLDTSRSTSANELPRGFAIDTAYPNRVNDPTYTASFLRWPTLTEICQSGLNCLFTACKTTCCEPKPDTRPFKTDGSVNFATWEKYGVAASGAHQAAFMAAWDAALSESVFDGCEGYTNSDGCGVSSPPTYGASNSIVSRGPGVYGTPARFKYGGVLRWGAQWQEPNLLSPDTPVGEEGTPPPLYLAGTIKSCHKDVAFVQVPNEWGLFHCAEGFAEGPTPVTLGEQARQAAIGRLDCTHISWPRHIVCSSPEVPKLGDAEGMNVVIEGSSTLAANAQLEAILEATVLCQEEGTPGQDGIPGNDGAQAGCSGTCYGYYS
jgi:hypothetical protein